MSVTAYYRRLIARTNNRRDPARIAPPVLAEGVRFPYGAFQFKARIAKGTEFEIRASTDLKNWRVIVQDTAPEDVIEYVDPEASKFNYRFYSMSVGSLQSANVFGYATTLLAPGFSMIANPFDTASSSVAELFKDLPEGTRFNKFDSRCFQLTENCFYDGKWTRGSEQLLPGEGGLLFNPTRDYRQLSFTGSVLRDNLSIPIPAGFSVRSYPIPQPGSIHGDMGFPLSEGDVIHIFDRDKQKYVLYPYDPQKWSANPPVVGVAESFWVAKSCPENWAIEIPQLAVA